MPGGGKRISRVWEFFKLDAQKTRAQCTKCLKWLKYSGNTSNFAGHLLTTHRINLRDQSSSAGSDGSSSRMSENQSCGSSRSSPVPSQMTLDESFEYINSFNDSGNRSEMFTNAIATWLARDMVAANTITGEGFIKMFQMISARYKIPHPNTIKAKIDRKFVGAKKFIIEKLKSFPDIALTADCWTHQYTNNQYLGVTAHGFNGRSIDSYCIACLKFTETHSAENLRQLFESTIESLEIDKEKIVACVTDNARNIKNSIDLFIGPTKHASCFAHSLNLIVKKAIKEYEAISKMIQSVKDIVTFFHHSAKATTILNQLQESPLKLIQDVPTRWNSTYMMIERFLSLREPVSKALSKLDTDKDMIPNSSLKTLSEVQIVLKPFFDITNRLSTASHPSISQIIPIVTLVKMALSSLRPSYQETRILVEKLENELNVRFADTEFVELYNKATILDPRFKNYDFQSVTAGANAVMKIDNYLKACRPLMTRSASAQRSQPNINDIFTFRRVRDHQSSSNFSLDFSNYLDSNYLPLSTDPLLFWINNFPRESELTKLALRHLIVPATSVPSERLFSKAGDVLSKKRSSLSPKRVEELLIISCLPAELIASL
ncbi:E3 SUMO-protein ligase ZBED1-like [Brevipalpus obovatus]|uniref:E3 SUMO-protein ligase ZBED1-like n=1 Tax=Brevipalpus obovatus TaxID=246614 RepID=UPI003D9F8668